jgi:hypothetical protein
MDNTHHYPELYAGAYYDRDTGRLVVHVVNNEETQFITELHLNAELERYTKHNVRSVRKGLYKIRTVKFSYNFLIDMMKTLGKVNLFSELKNNEIECLSYFVDDINNSIVIEVIDLDEQKKQIINEIVTKIAGSADFMTFENIPSSSEYSPAREHR